MRKLVQAFVLISSILVTCVSLLIGVQILLAPEHFFLHQWLLAVSTAPTLRVIVLALLLLVILATLAMFFHTLDAARLRRTRVRRSELGSIDISVEALENIALNAAKAAQAGVKSAKARVSQGHDRQLEIVMIVVLFTDVEIPSQMARIQDRVKKDVERYTGIPVSAVEVKVSRVELLGSRVESGGR